MIEASNFINQYLKNSTASRVTVISSPFYLWIPQYILDLPYDYKSFHNKSPAVSEEVIMIVDREFREMISEEGIHTYRLKILNSTEIVKSFALNDTNSGKGYPYTILTKHPIGKTIEVRSNH